jgi:predicted ribosomally synthesized peptide with nif11-like leader
MMDSSGLNGPYDCLGSTCLKWGAEGKIFSEAHSLVMGRMAQVDQELVSQVPGHPRLPAMSIDQLKAFLRRMQDDPALRQAVQAAATADDVAQLAGKLGYEFSGDELLRLSGQKVGRVTVTKQDIPGEYN